MFGLIATLSLVVVGAHSAVFSDDFAYNNMLPLAAAAYSDHPDACVRNHFNGQIYRFYKVDCKGPWSGTASVSCAAYTALLPSRKAIVLSFRGTNTPMQLFKELVHCRLSQEPRTGDEEFADRFNKTIDYAFRVIHANDGVPHVPPEKFGYRHHKQENGRDDTNPSNFLIFSATGLDLSIRDTVASWRTKRLICKAFTLVVTLCLAASLNAVRLFDYNFVRNQMFPLAAAAYSDEPRGCILNRFKGYNGTHGNLFFDHNLVQCDGFENDCYGFLATLTEQSAIVLSFRGTNYLSQLKNEVATSAAVVPMGLGEVSWYFYNAFSKVWGNDAKGVKGLERAFKDQIERHPKYEIWVTVLSLGGAMASLAAYHIAKTYNKISERINERIKLVTFGEPRTGNAAYAEDFNKKMFGLIATLSLVVVGAHSAVFSDDFAYNNMLPLAAAAYSDHPDACVRNHFNGQIYRFYKVDCKGPWSGTASVSCAAYTALLPSRKAIVLSFRGTNTPMQLFKELVHCRLSQEQHSEYEIWITGHSLGGALASLAASYLVEKRFAPSSKIKLMTFGQPRTGDEEFADRFNKTIDYAFRVIHANDGVPHVPPEKFGYRHHKQEVYYSGQDMLAGKGKMCNPGQCSDKINWLTYDFSNTHKCYYGKAFTLVVTLCLAASLNAVRLFDYNFVRNQMFPLAAAAYSDEPRGCILNRLGYNGTHGNLVPMGSGEVSWYFYNAFSNVWGNDAKGVKGLERAFKNQIERHPKYEIWVTVHRSEVPWRLWQRITSPKLITRYLSG
ncbi:unnamed protein product [Cylicocyclus nassatus]|uniref:Fungal lipase-type domain-containing protein n=1 Tax=Cylicocyclus nassatus TaxID=53992 RepID=A0AA36M3Z0_CYLNA|nr:unnamed protein product [Cylicocyclus nassatus]